MPYVNKEDFETILENRVRFWVDGENVVNLYLEMYSNLIDAGCFDDCQTPSVSEIVDNDCVNYCKVIDKGCEDYTKLKEIWDREGCACDVSTEEFEYYGKISQLEAFDEENEMFLVRL